MVASLANIHSRISANVRLQQQSNARKSMCVKVCNVYVKKKSAQSWVNSKTAVALAYFFKLLASRIYFWPRINSSAIAVVGPFFIFFFFGKIFLSNETNNFKNFSTKTKLIKQLILAIFLHIQIRNWFREKLTWRKSIENRQNFDCVLNSKNMISKCFQHFAETTNI